MDENETKKTTANKPATTFKGQARRQEKRGLEGIDRVELTKFLTNFNYYRFTGYLYHRRIVDKEGKYKYKDGTTFQMFKELYRFDTQLRRILFDATAQLEIAFRTRVVNFYCLEKKTETESGVFDFELDLEKKKKENSEIQTFFHWYINEGGLRAWAQCEFISFGVMIGIFENEAYFNQRLRQKFVKTLGNSLTVKKFLTQINLVNNLRNVCAHHCQLIGQTQKADHDTTPLTGALTALEDLLRRFRIKNTLKEDLCDLVENYHCINDNLFILPQGWGVTP